MASFCAVVLLAGAVPAQQSTKRPLSHDDYDTWRSIQGRQLSRDGGFVAYALVPQDGDGEVVARNIETSKEWRHLRGAQPTMVPRPDPSAEPGTPPPSLGPRLSFTADSRFLVFQILPTKEELERARKEKKKPEDAPRNALGIMDLATGNVTRIERVKSFQVPDDGSGFIAYQLEPSPEKKSEESQEKQPAPDAKKKQPKKEFGSDVVLRNMADGSERVFNNVVEYSISKDARVLVYTVSSRKDEDNGVFAVEPQTGANPAALLAGKGRYSKLTWDENQTRLAFISDRDSAESERPSFKLYRWMRAQPVTGAREVVSNTTPGFRAGWVVSDKASPSFSRDGSRLFFGTSPGPGPEKEGVDDVPPEEKVIADLWHWRDDFIQPMQKVRSTREQSRSYMAVVHEDGKFVQLADETLPQATPAGDGRRAIGTDDRPYRMLVGVDANYSDIYLVNTADGSRRQVLVKHRWGATWSPDGNHALYFDGKDWNSVSAADGSEVNLTEKLGVNFWREDWDAPSPAAPYGSAGWTAGDRFVLLYDRYDIWQISPDGRVTRNLTGGIGRQQRIEFRYVKLDSEEKFIDPAKPLLLAATSQETRDSGFYRARIDGGGPQKLIMQPKYFSNPSKAKDAELLLFTASTFSEYPDLLVSGPDFKDMKRISDANPQKAGLAWGTSELIGFRNLDGVPLKGILIKPEGFDPNKKYPMLVYIYERLSQGLHRFVDPRPGHSINFSYYASNGYLVFMPDIVYTVGYPGESALKCVLPGVQAVADRGFVDEQAIGIQGHSWGGYQIAYMITRTTRFKAASAGAPVANMTSAYSGIRWGTGLPRQFQYERTQSRIGGSLWEQPDLFIENSPVFRADRITTPLLMIHNDNDDAVPWYQGIEMFLALRRLGKEVYMFNYNGEPHGLRKRVNQKDYTLRLQQFFDHHLRGAPMPDWMERGIPYLEREKEKEKTAPEPDVKASGQGA